MVSCMFAIEYMVSFDLSPLSSFSSTGMCLIFFLRNQTKSLSFISVHVCVVLDLSPSGTVGSTIAGQWNHAPSIQGIYDTITGSCREQKSDKMKIHHRCIFFSICEVKCKARIRSKPFKSWEELLLSVLLEESIDQINSDFPITVYLIICALAEQEKFK